MVSTINPSVHLSYYIQGTECGLYFCVTTPFSAQPRVPFSILG